MTVNRIPWALAARGDRLELCVLIAGYPHPIVPAGVALTDVVWSDDPDPAWHGGETGITPKGWLDVPTGRDDDPPDLVVSEKLSPVTGTIDVEPVQVSLTDPAGAVSTLTANRNELPATPIAATLTAASTGPLVVMSTEGFPSSGDLYLGREVIGYASRTTSAPYQFETLTRGKYGTVAQDHRLISSQIRPSAFGNPSGAVSLPSLLGRRVTLWLLRFTGATTATDPTLVFDGRVGPGASLRGAGWSIPVEHAIAALSQELRAVPISFTGYHHPETSRRGAVVADPPPSSPLWVRWAGRLAVLNSDNTAIDARGWHSSPTAFLDAFRRAAGDAGFGGDLRISAGADGSILINASAGADSNLIVNCGWGDLYTSASDTEAAHRTPPMPAAYVRLAGPVRLTLGEAGQIPTVPSISGLPSDMDPRYALVTGEDEERRVSIIGAIGSDSVTLEARTGDAALLYEPTGATVGICVSYSSWWRAWRYGILPLWDNLQGINGVADSFDWDRVEAFARRAADVTPLLPAFRDYVIAPGDELVGLLANELRLTGLTLATYRGRIACVRSSEVAATEPLAAQIPKRDLLDGDPAAVEVGDGLATVFVLTVPGQGTVRAVDVAAEAEHGAGETIACDASAVRLDGFDLTARWEAVAMHGMTVIGPHRRPYRIATVRLPVSYAGVELGDVVTLTEWLLPTGSGGRGLSGAPCVVVGRRFNLTRATIELDGRLSAPELAGYAPEALVSAVSGAALTIDTSYLGSQGPHGFADTLLADDASVRADGGTSTFTAGDEVQLLELDTLTPTAPLRATVLSASSTTVTLDTMPGGTWATLASTPGKVMLAFAPYADATAAQRRYAFLASSATHLINAATRARRYAP